MSENSERRAFEEYRESVGYYDDDAQWLAIRDTAWEFWQAARQVAAPEPFLVKHYTNEEGPIIKGNGFDGLRIGDDREEAEQFVSFVNAKMQVAAPVVPIGWKLVSCGANLANDEPLQRDQIFRVEARKDGGGTQGL